MPSVESSSIDRAGARPVRMKLAILGTRGIPAAYGGFETFAEQLAVRLAQRGHQVTVYAEADQAGLPDTWYQGVRIRHIYRPHWGAASIIWYDCCCLSDARHEHDLLYMLGYGAAWACWWARSVWGQKVWLNVDGLEWSRSKWGGLARTYLRVMEWVSSWAPTRVLADAQAIADRYRCLYPNGVPCSFIPYGAPLVYADTESESSDVLARFGLEARRYVLVVARPEPENHLLEIVEGHAHSVCDWPLIIVGDVKPINSYQKRLLVRASHRVRFIGGVYDLQELADLRLHAACHVHGHSVGGTNPSLLEALACGNVVIAHDNPFNREVARDAALYFQSADQLVDSLNSVQAWSPDARQVVSDRARAIVAQHYTWDHITSAYEALMQSERAGAILP